MKLIKNLEKHIGGKIVKKVDTTSAANGITIEFTDGTRVWLEAEAIGHGLYAPVAYDPGTFVTV